MSTVTARPLPGIRFDVPAAPLREALPRMDIAFFVGFAARGPVDVPVAVESLADFEAVFGAEMVLLHQPDGEAVRALLHPSLGQFFAQGGRRAWVMRVTGPDAVSAHVPVQRMLQVHASADGRWRAEPAWMTASSAGAWADRLALSSWVNARALSARATELTQGAEAPLLKLVLKGAAVLDLRDGETLRIRLDADEWLHGCVSEIGRSHQAPDGSLQRAVSLGNLCTIKQVTGEPSLSRMVWQEADATGRERPSHAVPAQGAWQADGRLRWTARLPAHVSLGVGEVVQLRFRNGAAPAWVALDELHLTALSDDEGGVTVALLGQPWRVPNRPMLQTVKRWVDEGDVRVAHGLRACLLTQGLDSPDAGIASAAPPSLTGLGLGEAASSADLPSALSLASDQAHFTRLADAAERATPAAQGPRARRFPLAALPAPAGAFWLPLSTPENWNAPDAGQGLIARTLQRPRLDRDGLADFSWRLFADLQLAGLPTGALATSAQDLIALHAQARPLRGLHAAFGHRGTAIAEEPTLLLAPDATQPGWVRAMDVGPARIRHRAPRPAPVPADAAPPTFAPCGLRPLQAPTFLPDADPDPQGNHRVSWTSSPGDAGAGSAPMRYELQESMDADFSVHTTVACGPQTHWVCVGKPRGRWHYRVRACQGGRLSAWSGRLEVRVGQSEYALRTPDDADLLAVHRLMLRVAAARGDMLAVLSLPQRHDWATALMHVDRLRSPEPLAEVPGLNADEGLSLSHGCLQHPWVRTQRHGKALSCPPDGAVAGQLAASAWTRGAWQAVANRALLDVTGVTRDTPTAEQNLLLQTQLNPVLAQPHGIVIGGEDTLCTDDLAWRPVHVRRLMCLLRRAAIKRGAQYVFEPNGPALRRTVERAFESLLDTLHQRGAFAGRSAREAFEVVVDEELNTPGSVDAGRLCIELKFAPAQAMRFLVIRLVRHGEQLQALEGRG